MPATYAHITLVNEALSGKNINGKIPSEYIDLLSENLDLVELGSIGPDYPALCFRSQQSEWAGIMHRNKIGALINQAIFLLKTYSSQDRDLIFPWLAGFLSHIVADGVIHPVINIISGAEYENANLVQKGFHVFSEMNQDMYIYDIRLKLVSAGINDHLGSALAASGSTRTAINPIIKDFWEKVLVAYYPEEAKNIVPDINFWHAKFIGNYEDYADPGNEFFIKCARHVSEKIDQVYPTEIDGLYVDDLKTPIGKNMDYDEIFDLAVASIVRSWSNLVDALYLKKQYSFINWNADNGLDEQGNRVYWSVQG